MQIATDSELGGVKIYSSEGTATEKNGKWHYGYWTVQVTDAEGMPPAKMNYETGEFDYDDWADEWFVTENRPCMLKSDGTVDYYLAPEL